VVVSCIIIITLGYKMGYEIKVDKRGQLKIQATTSRRFVELGFSKKAQLRIQEMAFMLLAVFLFFTLVGLFALTLFYNNLNDSAFQIAEDRTLSSVTNLADTPELSCVAAKSNCVDSDKLINLVGKDIYGDLWPFSSLRVISFRGFEKDESELIECTKANYPNCDIFTVYDKEVKNERVISTFVALCRKHLENSYTYDKCETAKIIAGTELRRGGG
jgi:hypothetical protein